jgi:hypothetical protein
LKYRIRFIYIFISFSRSWVSLSSARGSNIIIYLYIYFFFQVVGEPFKRQGQLFTVNAFVEREGQSKQLPLVFVLMSRRTQADYENSVSSHHRPCG